MIPPVVILTGGLATRLYPRTLEMPKSLIEIAGKPFICHQLKLLKLQGINNVILCTGKFGEMIKNYVGDGHAWGLKVEYSYDGDTLLGTGGALKKAIPLLPDMFWVLYGDSYLDIDFEPILAEFKSKGKPVLMTIYHNKNQLDKSNILYKNGNIMMYNKKKSVRGMEHIDYGLCIMKKKALDEWPQGIPFDLSEVFIKFIERGKVSVFEANKRFYEIGSLRGIKETEQYLCDVNQI